MVEAPSPSLNGCNKAERDRNRSVRPGALKVKPEGVPERLKAERRWLVWRYFWRDSRWTKLPRNARTGYKGDSTDPETWSTFAEALAAYLHGEWDGIGFALGDGFAGVDLDDAIDPTTGALKPWAARSVAELDSYTEISPSGTGTKTFLFARLLGDWKKVEHEDGAVEVYDSGRYFTVTGHRLPDTPLTVNDRQAQLDSFYTRVFAAKAKKKEEKKTRPPDGGAEAANGNGHYAGTGLSDDQILTIACRAKNGAAIRALYNGDTSAHGGDESRADGALVYHFAFYTKDVAQLDRLCRGSQLYRDKWDEVHYGDGRTYLQKLIDDALADVTGQYSRGTKRKRPKNKRREPAPDNQGGNPTEEQESVALIRGYWRSRYDFIFTRAGDLYSAKLGRVVKPSEACYAPSSELVALLECADDAPTDPDDIHKHFGKWAKTAYVDERNARPPEEATGELCPPAMEQFRHLVRGAVRTVVSLGENFQRGKDDRTEVQKKPLIEFARAFALHNGNKWGNVRGLSIWSKVKGGRIKVAIRVELFQELRCCPELARLTYDKFADLCVQYGIGTRCKVRGGDERAVLLEDEFSEGMVAEPEDGPPREKEGHPDGQGPRARTGENDDVASGMEVSNA